LIHLPTLAFGFTDVYAADGSEANGWSLTPVVEGDGSTKYQVTLAAGSNAVVAQFEIYLTAANLPAQSDFWFLQTNTLYTGGLTYGDQGLFYGPYTNVNPNLTPGKMGLSSTNNSNMASSPVWADNWYNGLAYNWGVTQGSTETGNGNGTYGDMAAKAHVGVAAGWGGGVGSPTDLGSMNFDLTGVAGPTNGFTFNFVHNPGNLAVIDNNEGGAEYHTPPIEGMGTSDTIDWVGSGDHIGYNGIGDSVNVSRVPEPSTLALLGCGLFGLLAYAWRKRK